MQPLTKTQCEAIAQSFASQARPMKEVLRMARAVSLRSGKPHPNELRMLDELDTLWGLALCMRDHLRRFPKFDELKFLEATQVSPQLWRFHKFIDGKYVKDESAAHGR